MLKNGLQSFGQVHRFAFTSAVLIAASLWVRSTAIAQDFASRRSVSTSWAQPSGETRGEGIGAATLVGPSPKTARGSGSGVATAPSYGVKGFDLSIGTFAQLTGTRTIVLGYPVTGGTRIDEFTQGETPSAGILGTIHQQFNPWLGYNVNLGYTKTTENYFAGPGIYTNASIPTHVYELSGSMVVRGPISTSRMQTFAQAGGGTLTFLPAQTNFKGSVQFRPVLVFGVGVEYRLSTHWAIRAEYRGLFYKNPDFRNPSIAPLKLFTVTNQPTVSLVYRFGGKKTGK